MSGWRPMRTLSEDQIGRAILVWVPAKRSVFAVVPYNVKGRDLRWWGADADFPYRATSWRVMPAPPQRAGPLLRPRPI